MGEKYPALRCSDNMGEDFENGVWTVECNSWKEFEDRIEQFKKAKYKYMWRGQSCEKPLLPTIYRVNNTPDDKSIDEHLNQFRRDMPGASALKQFLERAKKERTKEFEKALSEYYKMIHPKADDNDPKENYVEYFINDIYWAIGRHQGLKTPLLDWTMDRYKALFLLFVKEKKRITKGSSSGLLKRADFYYTKNKRQNVILNFWPIWVL